MPSLCNSTLSSSPDRDRFQYWSSFSEKPFRCGDRLQLYKGKLNGKGPRGGQFSVVKMFVDRPGTEPRCCKELDKARVASDWLTRFLAHGHYRLERVRFAQLQMAPMDQVSLLNKLFAHNKRRPSSGEWILLEEMVEERSTLLQFVDSQGRMYRERAASASSLGVSFRPSSSSSSLSLSSSPSLSSSSSFSSSLSSSPSSSSSLSSSSCSSSSSLSSSSPTWAAPACSLDDREMLEALVHFSYEASGGRLVLCGLEGWQIAQGRLLLKTPVLHSADRAYGETDQGPQGVSLVMSRHVCNRHCRRVLSLCPSSHGPLIPQQQQLARHQQLMLQQQQQQQCPWPSPPRRCPSAPPESDVFSENDGVTTTESAPAPPYDAADFGIDVSRLPVDVFASPVAEPVDWRLLFQLALSKVRAVPEEPPPPYSEFIEDLR